jgi:hypothetical protein
MNEILVKLQKLMRDYKRDNEPRLNTQVRRIYKYFSFINIEPHILHDQIPCLHYIIELQP